MKRVARPIFYLLILGTVVFVLYFTGNVGMAARWLGGAAAQFTAFSFWVAVVIGLYPAIRFDELLTSIVIATILSLLTAAGLQDYLSSIGENVGFSGVFGEQLVLYGTGLVSVYSVISIVYFAIKHPG